MDTQHRRQQSRLEARSEAYSRQGRPAKGLSAARDRSRHLHPGGLAKDGQIQHPIEPRIQTGQGRQGHQFFRTVRKILPGKPWRKRQKDKEAINLSVTLAEKPEVKRRGYAGSYGADKAEPVTGYTAGPYPPPLCPSQVGYPPRPPYSEIYNRPPNQGYQPYPPPSSEIYDGPPHQGYQPYPPPHPSYHPYPPSPGYPPNPPPRPSYPPNPPPKPGYPPNPPPCPSYHPYPPNPGYPPPCPSYHPYPPNPGYPPNPPPCPSYHPYPPNPLYQRYQPLQDIADSIFEEVSVDFIENGIGTLISDGNNDGSYDGGSPF